MRKSKMSEYKENYYREVWGNEPLQPKRKLKKNKIADKKYYQKLIDNWKDFGYYLPPTEKEVIEEIELDELKESDEVDYITLEECIENKEDTDEEL